MKSPTPLKRYWKWLLFGAALAAFIAILYYSNLLLGGIAQEERNKVELWANAVKHKAELVNSTNKFFNEIKREEGKRAQQFAQVFQKLNEASTSAELNTYLSEIENNKIGSLTTRSGNYGKHRPTRCLKRWRRW